MGLRVLVPVAGQSIAVTTVVVTVFLAALALGYRAGGEVTARGREEIGWCFALAAGWSGVWLTRFAVEGLFSVTAGLPPLAAVAAYALVGIAPVAYVLARTVVMLVEARAEEGAGRQAGGAFSASTIGNVLGGLVTALVVMQYAGVGVAVLAIAGLVGAAALVLRGSGWWRWRGSVAVATGLLAAGANVAAEKVAYVASTAHADYRLVDLGEGLRLLQAGRQFASVDDPGGTGAAYIEWLEDEVYGTDASGTTAVLMVGAGGLTFGRGRAGQGVEVTFVDVDGVLEEVAGELLHGPPAGPVTVADGRAFLLSSDGRWDVIVVDAFSDRVSIPSHLVTREALAAMRGRLVPGGRLYVNVIARVRPGAFEVRLDRTIRSVFAWCETHAFGEGREGMRNRVYACERHVLDGEAVVYGDADTRAEVDGARFGLWRGGGEAHGSAKPRR